MEKPPEPGIWWKIANVIHVDVGARERLAQMIYEAVVEEREACAKIAEDFADECMRETYKADEKARKATSQRERELSVAEANAFRAQRVAAANIAGQIRRRKD